MVYEYGVFRALKKANNGECWNDWPEEYRTWPENRQKLPAEVETEAQYQMFLQYIFYTQWMKVKKAANDAESRSWEMFLSMWDRIPWTYGVEKITSS